MRNIESTILEKNEGSKFLNDLANNSVSLRLNNEKWLELKKEYQSQYPESLNEIELVFTLRDFLQKQKQLKEKQKEAQSEYDSKVYYDFAKYQFLMTEYVCQNKDISDLDNFWEIAKTIAQQNDALNEFEILKRGILGQVAVLKILEAIGEQPRLSSPSEDAYNSVDLWSLHDVAIQVKSSQAIENPAILEVKHLTFPLIEVKDENLTRYYSEKYYHDASRFKTKIDRYAQKTKKNIKGYMLIIPFDKINPINGEPSDELINFFKNNFKK